jgi:hypothetical protein
MTFDRIGSVNAKAFPWTVDSGDRLAVDETNIKSY